MKSFSDEVKEAAEKWAHPALLEIWTIISLPDCDDDGLLLRSDDIEKIAQAVIKLNKDFNKPEIKALRLQAAV